MNHADRIQFWKRPKDKANWPNSLSDTFAAMPAGKMLVYRHDAPSMAASEVNKIAQAVAASRKGALVQWPEEACNGNQHAVRKWMYAIQKRA
jgi:hypothetical protein